ncbi:Imm1 family immunity protein [Prauserella cavernicola]|uniref:Immunity protein Imm1 n=1 Tax=Prauserella cavernicola TaxID=2800127 RepID=A0A934QSY1_9PSEU|nr:Imm1 family immunity protein [Prauserella cavernicola]MBK1785745.1 hypothetical protein [Prauserella cavernicola]
MRPPSAVNPGRRYARHSPTRRATLRSGGERGVSRGVGRGGPPNAGPARPGSDRRDRGGWPGCRGGRNVPVNSAADVDELIALLGRADVGSATIQGGEEDAVLDVQVHDGLGYLLYAGDDLFGYSVGAPDSPALVEVSEVGFPAGSGMDLEQFRDVLVEFAESRGRLPTAVSWRSADEFSG